MHVNKSVSLDMKALSIIDDAMLLRGLPFSTIVNSIVLQWKTYEDNLNREYERIEKKKAEEKKDV